MSYAVSRKQSFFSQAARALQSLRAENAMTMLSALFLVVCVSSPSWAETGIVSTLAGSCSAGGFVNGEGAAARFNSPKGIVVGVSDDIYVADSNNHSIRKITQSGKVSTLAGNGKKGTLDGDMKSAQFNTPTALTARRGINNQGGRFVADTIDQLYVAELNAIRRVGKNKGEENGGKDVTTLHIQGAQPKDYPVGLLVENDILFVSNYHSIFRYDTLNQAGRGAGGLPGEATKEFNFGGPYYVGGSGEMGFVDGFSHASKFVRNAKTDVARFNTPIGLTGGSRTIHGKAGTPSGFTDSVHYVADTKNHSIRKIEDSDTIPDQGSLQIRTYFQLGRATTLAGNGKQGFADGYADKAQFNHPTGIVIGSTGNFYVADYGNRSIRMVTPRGDVTTLALVDDKGNAAQLNAPWGITNDKAGNFYVTDAHCVRKIVISKDAPLPTAATATVTGNSMKPGLWETTFGSDMMTQGGDFNQQMNQMMEQMKKTNPAAYREMQAKMAEHNQKFTATGVSTQVCITPEMAKQSVVPVQQQGKCTIRTSPRAGNTVKMSYTCTDPSASGEAEITFQSDTAYSMTMRANAGGQSMNSQVSARWLGADCGNVKPQSSAK